MCAVLLHVTSASWAYNALEISLYSYIYNKCCYLFVNLFVTKIVYRMYLLIVLY